MSSDLPRIISSKELKLIVPYSPQHILRLEKRGKFPKRIRIGERRVGWRLSDIEEWLAARTAESKGCRVAVAARALELTTRSGC